MFTENFFTLLLDLEDGWVVESVNSDVKQSEVSIKIGCQLNRFNDPETGEECKLYDHAAERKWRHLDTLQFKTFIRCRLPRLITKDGKVKTVTPNWASNHERHTYLFEHAVIDLLKATKNQSKTAELMRCKFNVVNRIIHMSSERGMQRRPLSKVMFDHLSIDKKFFKKGHNYVTVLSHPTSGCVVDIEEGRSIESCTRLLTNSLTKKQRAKVSAISMDMWQAFMTTAKQLLPKAQIVHDRFHLVKYLNDAIDKVRRREVKKHEELKGSRYALLKNLANLTEKQRLQFEAISEANYEVSKAWQVRENFKSLFSTSKGAASILYGQWAKDSLKKGIKEIQKVVNMFSPERSGVSTNYKLEQRNG